jgi:hypothetical protein
MKTGRKTLLAAVLVLIGLNANSQDLNKSLNSIKEKIKDVQVDKMTYKQSLDIIDADKAKLSLASGTADEKGKTTSEKFEFYLSDIDKNTVVRKTSGKKMFVNLSINNNQKFIKHFKEDKLEGYTNELEIQLTGADEAQDLVNLIKTAIPLVHTTQKDWKTHTDALNWLKSNVTNSTAGQVLYEQSFSFGDRKDYTATFMRKKTDQKNVSTDETYEFNLPDINSKKLAISVSGAQLSVTVATKGNDPYIKYSKNKDQQSFVNDFEIMTDDVDMARNIIAALTTAAEKSKLSVPDFANLQKSLDFITGKTADVTSEKKTLGQKIAFTAGSGTKTVFTYTEPDSKGKAVESRYEYYLNDLDPASVAFKINRDKVLVTCASKNKTKFIKYFKDNVLQSFTDDVSIITSDIETSREMTEAFKAAIKNSAVQPATWKSVGESVSFLSGTLKGETVGTDVYKLDFSSVSADPLDVKYVVGRTDAKGVAEEMSYEFYPYLLDPASVKIASSGKYLSIQASVKGKDQYIKVFKKGEQQSFDNGVELMAFDSKQAQDIAEAIKYISGSGKPKDKVWGDKAAALKFITDNAGVIKNGGTEIKQKVELTDNDPCKISFTVTRTDEKGKATDELYEFGLSDMNKTLNAMKVSGKNIEVSLFCKNKEKLVKVYKNGAQQAWGSEVKFLTNDVEIARNLSEAFKFAMTECEK